jgi:hypothetical protein
MANLTWRSACLSGLLVVGSACAPPAPPPATPAPTPTSPAAAVLATLQTGPAATARVLSAATTIAGSPVQISSVALNTVNFAESTVTVSNVSSAPVDLSGWTLFVGTYSATLPTNQYMTILPSQSKIIHLSGAVPGSDPTSGDNIYLGASSIDPGMGVLTQGDRVVLMNPQQQVASAYQLP